MSDPFEEEKNVQEDTPKKEKKSWAEIKAAYWKSPWYNNFKFVHWKDVVIFLLAIILIVNTYSMYHQYQERINNPCDYCPLYKGIPEGGAPLWNEVNGTLTPTALSNSTTVTSQGSQ